MRPVLLYNYNIVICKDFTGAEKTGKIGSHQGKT